MTDAELLARIDERTSNIYRLVEKQEKHLEELSGKVENHGKCITGLKTTVYGKENGEEGLCHNVDKLNTFKMKVIVVFFFLLGSGVLGVGAWELIKFIS